MFRRSLAFPLVALALFACSSDDDPTGTGGAGGTTSQGGTGGTGGTGGATGGMGGTGGEGAMGGGGGTGGMEDTTPPSVTITDDVMDPVATGDVTFTFTFSEDVGTSFEAGDVAVTGGTAGAFDADGNTATLVVSPPEMTAGTIEVTVATGTFEDAAGNSNDAEATASQDYDTVVETVLVDFEANPPPLMTGFGDLFGAVVVDPTDPNNSVGQLDKTAAAQLWGGNTVSYCNNFGSTVLPLTATESTMSMRVWSPDANIPIRLKVENSGDPGVSVETETLTTMAGAWETLVFDFNNEVGGTAALNPAATYDKMSVFPNFGTDGATAGQKIYYIDDITFIGATFPVDCPPIPVDLRPEPEDAWIGYNGGNLTIFDQFAGGAQAGQAAAGAAYVIPFVMPAIPSGGFTVANLQVFNIATAGDGSLVNLHGDLYGLPFRTAADVANTSVLMTSMFHADTNVDANATLIVDDFLTSATANGAPLETDNAGDAAIVAYLNAQVAAGAVQGDYIYLRISPDSTPPIGGGYNWVLEAAVDAVAPPNRPTLTVQ